MRADNHRALAGCSGRDQARPNNYAVKTFCCASFSMFGPCSRASLKPTRECRIGLLWPADMGAHVEEDSGPDPDPGIADIIEEITRIWSVEDSERRKLENGFEWLPGSHAVQVRVSRHVERPDRIRIWITTDFLRSVPVESSEFVHLVGLISKFECTGNSLVYPPLHIWRAFFDNQAELHLFSSAYVDQHTAGWLPGCLARMAIMQPINAVAASSNAARIGALSSRRIGPPPYELNRSGC
jgi:hypothetical protein